MFCVKIIVAKEGIILKVNEIIMTEIQALKEDEPKINKQNLLADANTLINLGISVFGILIFLFLLDCTKNYNFYVRHNDTFRKQDLLQQFQ